MHLKRIDKAAKITVITKIQDKSNEKANKMIATITAKTSYSIERIQKINLSKRLPNKYTKQQLNN
jgi:hypothetical protein